MRKYQINLIPKKKRDLADTIIYFFLHYLRYIIVLTQIVVIGVFFFRFQVDQEIIDLKESIDQKIEIMKVTKPLITEATSIDNKIGEIKNILDGQNVFLKNISYVFSVIPQDIVLTRVEVEKNSIKLGGNSNTIAAIQRLNEKLKKDKMYKSISISELAKAQLGFTFLFILHTN